MATSTETKTNAEAVASAKLIAACKSFNAIHGAYVAENFALSETVKSESARLGYDLKQARQSLFLGFEACSPYAITEANRQKFRDTWKSTVSRILSLAYPDKPSELDKATKYNEKNAKKSERIGLNSLYKIANGSLTFAEAIAKKAAKKGQTNGDKADVKETAKNLLSPVWKSLKVNADGHITRADLMLVITESLNEYLGEKSETAIEKA